VSGKCGSVRHCAPGSPPAPRPSSRDAQLLSCRGARLEQHDLRAPPLPAPVALGHVRDDPRGLQVIEPALHALAMRTHKPRPLTAAAGNRAPGHHRRQPDHQLLHRGRKPPRPAGVTEPEQVALDRVDPRLDPIITRRDTTPRTTGAPQQRAHHQPTRLSRQRRARRPIPTTTRRPVATMRCAFQRHRQRPKTPGARRTPRSRADARGTAGPTPSSRERASTCTRGPHPSGGGWRSVRRTATVGGTCICECSSRSTGVVREPHERPGWPPVFLVLAALSPAGRDKRPAPSVRTQRREGRNDAPTQLRVDRRSEPARPGLAPAVSRSLLNRA
jgi:hypothetical protein